MATCLTLETMHTTFSQARHLTEIFGRLTGTPAEQQAALKKSFRQLCLICHPDRAEPADKELAKAVFQLLNSLNALAVQRIEKGEYESPLPPTDATGDCFTYQVDGRALNLGPALGIGLFSTVYEAILEGECDPLSVKVAHQPTHNPHLLKEVEVLERLRRPSKNREREAFFVAQRHYLPRPVAGLTVQFPDLTERRLSVLGRDAGQVYPATELVRRLGGSLDRVHAYWIYRRLLLTLLMAQMRGYVHGAVTPDHLLVYPVEHGLVLIDWCGAARLNVDRLRWIDPAYKDYYPPEVFAKEPVNQTTDLYLAGKLLQYLLGGPATGSQFPGLPPEVADVVKATLHPEPNRRPQVLMDYFDRFEQAIERAHGKRRYVPLMVP